MKIVLASKSGVRKDILDKHGVETNVSPSNVDEDQVKEWNKTRIKRNEVLKDRSKNRK